MLTADILRSLIFKTIGTQIGSYTLPNSGGITPAIAVLPDPEVGYDYPPQGTTTVGIEVRIRQPLDDCSPLLGNTPMIAPRWEVRLLQQDPNQSAMGASNALAPVLSRSLDCAVTSPRLIPANPDKGIPEQVVIGLMEYLV